MNPVFISQFQSGHSARSIFTDCYNLRWRDLPAPGQHHIAHILLSCSPREIHKPVIPTIQIQMSAFRLGKRPRTD